MTPELDKLKAITRDYNPTKKKLDTLRDKAVEAVIAALKAGERPTDVTSASPFTAAYIRRIARENHIEPAAPGPKPPRA